MKILTVYGTRPEFIRLAVITRELDRLCDQTLVHTGQNTDPNLSDLFFEELRIRPPDMYLGVTGSNFAQQAGLMLPALDEAIERADPERIVILGDTNSSLVAAIVAARRGIPTFHLEAGNRCFDDRVPEEVNRRVIDHSTTFALPYTHRSKENLLQEGIPRHRIFVTGNPINEVMRFYEKEISESDVLTRMSLTPKGYIAATMHRAENVDDKERLERLLLGMAMAGDKHQVPIVLSLHPRTADRIKHWGIEPDTSWLRFHDPVGFFDFIQLERNALAVITDSGTVQEECCILNTPNVTIRDTTERPETLECGSNILTGSEPEAILSALNIVLEPGRTWVPPQEYVAENVSKTVSNIVLGYISPILLRA